jgi:two-component system, OmpR family, sensor kinase
VSIRLRVAVVFTLALAIAFALGSWLLAAQLRSVVLGSVDAGLMTQLNTASQLLPSPQTSARPVPPGDYLLQLIDPAGRVRASGPEAGTVPLLTPSQQQAARHGRIAVTTTVDGDAERVLAQPVRARPGWIAVAGASLEAADATVSALVTRLAIGGSIFVLIGGLGAYLLARAALAPAERLRREAAALSAQDPAARLAVPATRDEIAALAGTMNDLLGRLQRAIARQRAFVADASHELRTPFAVLSGELELAGRPGRTREELAEAVANAAEEAARLSRITDDLLTLASSDERQLTIRAEPTDLVRLVTRSTEQAGRRAADSGVTFQISAVPGMMALVDADRIRQAVDNLIDNALRFAPAGSQIEISAAGTGSDVTIAVADSGPGFPADFLPHAFERFRRPDGGRTRAAGGAGLGLAIVEAIARAHGGSAAASNRPAGGAVVQLRLPGVRWPAAPTPSPA